MSDGLTVDKLLAAMQALKENLPPRVVLAAHRSFSAREALAFERDGVRYLLAHPLFFDRLGEITPPLRAEPRVLQQTYLGIVIEQLDPVEDEPEDRAARRHERKCEIIDALMAAMEFADRKGDVLFRETLTPELTRNAPK